MFSLHAECLRDIGLYEDAQKIASKGDIHMRHTRWCHSMAGEEYARVFSWGNDPRRKVSAQDHHDSLSREDYSPQTFV